MPDVLIDNFDVVKFEKTEPRFDIWLAEKKVKMSEDQKNDSIISNGFGEYHTIQDFPIRGRSTYLHVCKRKWLNKDRKEIFSYKWELSEHNETRLNTEFVVFLKMKIETIPISISTLASLNGLNGQTLRKQYKEKISNYRKWTQAEHSEDFMLFPKNFMHFTKWSPQQQKRVNILFERFLRLQQAYNIYLDLVNIFNKRSRLGKVYVQIGNTICLNYPFTNRKYPLSRCSMIFISV